MTSSGLLSLHRSDDDFASLGGLSALKAFCKRAVLYVMTFWTFVREFSAFQLTRAGNCHPPGYLASGVGHDRVMATTTRTQRRYDHALRNLVRTTRDIHCAS